MRMLARALLFAACLSSLAAPFSSVASAQTPPETTFDFQIPEDVSGAHRMPIGENLVVQHPGGRHSLIRIRTEFITELTESARNL